MNQIYNVSLFWLFTYFRETQYSRYSDSEGIFAVPRRETS